MFETGKKAYFRNADFKAGVGTIVGKVDANSATVTLLVMDSYGNVHTVKKVNPDAEHVNQVENSYRERGYY